MEREKFLGTWKLKSFYIESEQGKYYPYGKNAKGHIIYSPDGYMSVILTGEARKKIESKDVENLSDIDKIRLANQFISYSGKYEINDNQITHFLENSYIPNWENLPQTRFFKFENNKLILTTPPFFVEGKEQILNLVWEKV